jgi:hypothetical protein
MSIHGGENPTLLHQPCRVLQTVFAVTVWE